LTFQFPPSNVKPLPFESGYVKSRLLLLRTNGF